MAAYSIHPYRGKPQDVDYCEDGVCRTVVYDSDGRKTTSMGCSPFHDTADTYVVKSEVRERVYSPHTTDYRQGEYVGGGHDKVRRPGSPGHPPELDDFVNRVQTEVSRPHNYPQYHHNNNARYDVVPTKPHSTNARYDVVPTKPHSAGYGGKCPDRYDDYCRNDSPTREWDRPVKHSTTRTPQMGMPTNSIDEAVGYLKGGNHNNANAVHHPGRRSYCSDDSPPRRYPPPSAYRNSSPPWPRSVSSSPPPPAHHYPHGRGHAPPPGIIDSNEAAKLYGGKIVRI